MLSNIFSRIWKTRKSVTEELLRIKIGGIEIEDNLDSAAKDKNESQKTKKGGGTNRVKSTKYTMLSFLPLNLFEQFRRIANFYFLCMAIIVVVMEQVSDSPVSSFTSISPLVFVISVTAIKQGYENYLKYKADNMVNKSSVTVVRNGIEEDIQCEDIKQGDLVKIYKDCDVPCDLVLLKTSDENGKCFITTANLDGETNLKTLLLPKSLPAVSNDQLQTLGDIVCESSKTDLYSFSGRIELSEKSEFTMINKNAIPLMAENVMLRGSRVKNTEWAIACAIYTGPNTKLSLNSKFTRNKMTSSEKFINKYLLFFLVLFIVLVITSSVLKMSNDRNISRRHAYLFFPAEGGTDRVLNFFAFLILFNYIIPISLYVTIEMHKFICSLFMEWDIHLYDEDTDQPCIVNTSDLNEELGQVNILFSDKTGTLTKNEMAFQQCSISGRKFIEEDGGLKEYGKNHFGYLGDYSKNIQSFFEALAICHTVQLNKKDEADSELEDILRDTSQIPYIFSIPLEQHKMTGILEDNENEIDSYASEDGVSLRTHRKSISLSGKPFPYHRAVSTDSAPQPTKPSKTKTHRRSHSSIPFSKDVRITGVAAKLRFQRNISTRSSLREYYAAPAYTTASLLERNDSIRRKKARSLIEKLDYQASSPDEKALVEASAKLGVIYLNDNNDILKLKLRIRKRTKGKDKSTGDRIVHYKRLDILEFTSDRKRMSVIVMDNNGEIWLYTKGAESHVIPQCKQNNYLLGKTQDHVNEFAREGLRTLAIARRRLMKTEYLKFKDELTKASNSLSNRVIEVENCQKKIECDLELLGATAVEDKLQDDVEETLTSLRMAGIKIWVLTGDKVETALNIALSCGHIPPSANKYFITHCGNELQIKEHLTLFYGELVRQPQSEFALLIDGQSLTTALKYTPDQFRDTAIKCHAVLCCRLSPLQKCEIVRLMKTVKQKPITAAIGDGANDVSMIQEAHVGLGIVGKEGRQAARCSDYAFAKFSMLSRMLFLHGHYSTQRLSLLVLYFFYKNLIFMGIQLYFQIDCLFSAQTIYDSIYLMLYNTVYTAFPILFISITEKIYPEDQLMSDPELYKKVSRNKLLSWRFFFLWIGFSFYHSLIIYMITRITFTEYSSVLNDGKSVGIHNFGTILIHNLVIVVNIKLLLESVYKTYVFISTVLLSIAAFMGSTFVYTLIDLPGRTLYLIYAHLLSSLNFWLLSALIVITALAPDLLLKALQLIKAKRKNIIKRKKSIDFESTDL